MVGRSFRIINEARWEQGEGRADDGWTDSRILIETDGIKAWKCHLYYATVGVSYDSGVAGKD